jgi:hypothetical protein
MNYLKLYNDLISKRQNSPYVSDILGDVEIHHVLPKCMDGDDSKENLVSLSLREHFLAHRLLAKIYPNSKISYAAWLMACFNRNNETVKISSHTYESLRREHAVRVSKNENIKLGVEKHIKGKKQSPEHIKARVEARKANGEWLSTETKKKISEAHIKGISEGRLSPFNNFLSDPIVHAKGVATRKAKGSYTWTEHQREKMRNKPNRKGYSVSEETKEKIRKGYETKVACPHCGIIGSRMPMGRWHFDNCKKNVKNVSNK